MKRTSLSRPNYSEELDRRAAHRLVQDLRLCLPCSKSDAADLSPLPEVLWIPHNHPFLNDFLLCTP